MPVVVYGCENWSLILSEDCRMRVFDNRVLRRIFRSKTYEVIRGWRHLHSEQLNDLHSSPHIIPLNK